MTDFTITPNERQTNPLWRRLVEHWTAQRDMLRARNDGDMDPIKTAHTRGEIAALNRLIALDSDVPVLDMPHVEQF